MVSLCNNLPLTILKPNIWPSCVKYLLFYMRNITPVAEKKHIFHMATNTYRNVAKTLREAPNTNTYGQLNVLSYWKGLCIDPVNRV